MQFVRSLQCGVADGEGFLSIWQVNQTTSNPKPYLVSKQKFVFLLFSFYRGKLSLWDFRQAKSVRVSLRHFWFCCFLIGRLYENNCSISVIHLRKTSGTITRSCNVITNTTSASPLIKLKIRADSNDFTTQKLSKNTLFSSFHCFLTVHEDHCLIWNSGCSDTLYCGFIVVHLF